MNIKDMLKYFATQLGMVNQVHQESNKRSQLKGIPGSYYYRNKKQFRTRGY